MRYPWVHMARCISVLVLGLIVCGCVQSYATPGRGANMELFDKAPAESRNSQSDGSVVDAINKRPLATLPTAVAVVRVQAPGYQSPNAEIWGSGAYCVVTSRDIDGMQEVLNRLEKSPRLNGLAPLNRLLLPAQFKSDLELRQAAAALHADMLLIYTLDTTFQVEDVAAPLTVVTLGLSPNQVAQVHCTASAILIDTRNGYIYGVAEGSERQEQLASGWTNAAAVDQTRRRVEAVAFKKLGTSLETMWGSVVKNLEVARD